MVEFFAGSRLGIVLNICFLYHYLPFSNGSSKDRKTVIITSTHNGATRLKSSFIALDRAAGI